MKTESVVLFAMLLGIAWPTLNAQMVWNEGTATFTFVHGDASADETLTIVPPRTASPPRQFERTYLATDFSAEVRGGVSHYENEWVAGFFFPCRTGVWQTGGASTDHAASSLTIDGRGLWTSLGTFGPTTYGAAVFPDIRGTVAAGEGSLASFSIHAEWGPDAFRSVLDYNYTITTTGDFAFSYFDWEKTVPDFLRPGEGEEISFSLGLAALGIEGQSSIYLRCRERGDPIPPPAPGSRLPCDILIEGGLERGQAGGAGGGLPGAIPVPEPSTYGLVGLAGIALAISLRRRQRPRIS